MHAASKTLAALLVLAVLTAAVPPPADAGKAPNRYSVVTLVNKTKFRVHYEYVWGDGERTWSNSIAPGDTYVHWWTFKRPNENWAPYFWVRLDGNEGWFKCRSFFSPDTSASSGREYAFMAKKVDGYWQIGLHPRLYTD